VSLIGEAGFSKKSFACLAVFIRRCPAATLCALSQTADLSYPIEFMKFKTPGTDSAHAYIAAGFPHGIVYFPSY